MVEYDENIGHEETNEIFLLWPWRVCFMKELVNSEEEMIKMVFTNC